MRLVELHVASSNSVLAVNPDAVGRVGTVRYNTVSYSDVERTFVRFLDGTSVEVAEPFPAVCALLGGAK